MSDMISSVKGMNDILPKEITTWHTVETILKDVANQFAYQEIRFPIVEKTELFKRSIGDLTDIVQKEMYSFQDQHNGDLLTLRPEGTAPCVRACLQNNLLHNQVQRLWYLGPLFRHERPQKGRYRQFHQFGIETFGFDSIGVELELLSMNNLFWQALGLSDVVKLKINTIGTAQERHDYQDALRSYLSAYTSELDKDSLNRLDSNPLRILDSKNPEVQTILEGAPKLIDFLSEASLNRFEQLCEGLDKLGINYQQDPNLVRGLDYYSHAVFEWVTDSLGAQGTVSAGGRYDALVTQLGGKPIPAAGFAVGIERLVLLLNELKLVEAKPACDLYVAIDKGCDILKVQSWLNTIRSTLPSLRVMSDMAGSSLKSQLKRANVQQAPHVLLFQDNEFNGEHVLLKDMSGSNPQQTLGQSGLIEQLSLILRGKA